MSAARAGVPTADVLPAAQDGGKLGRDRRVRRRWEFNAIHGKGVRVHTRHFVVIGLPTLVADGTTARIGCAVSRKVGKAVLRNRVRRLIKEVFRRMAAGLPAVDLVVIAKAPAGAVAEDGFSAAADELGPAFAKAARKALDRETA